MVSVDEVMEKDPPTIEYLRTVREAAILMINRQAGHVIVTDKGKPIGILTSGDIVARVVASGLDPSKVIVKSVMSSPLYTVDKGDGLDVAAGIMAKYRIRRLVVLDEDGEISGLLTLDSIARWLAAERRFEDPLLNALGQYSRPPSEMPYM